MTRYLEIQSDLVLQSLNFKEVRLKKGQLLTFTEVCKLIDKIGIIRYTTQVTRNTCERSLKRSNICFENGIRRLK